MNFRQLNETINLYMVNGLNYADIDAKSVYDNCVNKDFGSHTFEEADKFKEFVGITPETTEAELRGIRNTLVRYWADYVKEYKGDDWGRSRSKEESDREFKMGDQMQFFTTVIDMAIDNLPEEKRMHEDVSTETFGDRVTYLEETRDDLLRVLTNVITRYTQIASEWDEERQINFCDGILEILHSASVKLDDVARRIKLGV